MISDLKPYPRMKESGVPWLGEVPEHWEVLPLCAIARLRHRTNEQKRELLSVYLRRGVVPFSSVDEKRTNPTSEDLSKYQAVEPGDFVLNNQQAWRGSVGVSRYKGIVSPAYLVLALDGRLEREFADHLLSAREMVAQYLVSSKGVGSIQRNLYWPHLRRVAVLVPPPIEQAAIVRFLDHADRRIRRYIRAKQKLIKLLEEQKQAIMHSAVTRGLDPNVRLKPSGMEWLGDVPEHWEVRPAKWFFGEVDERSRSGDEELLSVSHLTGVTPRSQKNITMFMAESYVGHKLCRAGDLVINTMWAWMAALGVTRQTGLVSPSYGVYRPRPESLLLGSYADMLLRTRPYVSEYVCRSTGIRSSRLRLYPEQFLRIPVVCPPEAEQRAIVANVESKTASTTSAVAAALREIDLLREYRTRLIADVVTGKLDVREAAARLPDEAEEPETLDEIEAEGEADETSAYDTDEVPEEAEA